MRIALRLTTEDEYPLTAGLLKNIGLVIDRIKEDFPELRQSDRMFVIMTEWRKRREESPSAEEMVRVFEKTKLDKHIVCMVCL